MTNETAVKEELLEDVAGVFEEDTKETEAKEVEVVSVQDKQPNVNLAQAGVQKINQIGRELGIGTLEREEEIRSLQLGLATGKHVLLLGPPGTAKSALAEDFSSRISNANYFQWLLNRTSDPSELLGPISIKAMEKDQFLRKPDGKLPEAHVAFVDEILKSNSATLNILLPLMNERVWYNDGQRLPVNLKLLVGASNELPEEEELGAFYDRFIFRHWVEYIGDSKNQFNMLKRSAELRSGAVAPNKTLITLEEIEAVQKVVAQVNVTDVTINAFQKLVHELRNKKSITISDRRLVACIHIIQANAALEGRTDTTPDDMEHLAYVLWEKKEDIEEIQAIITKMMNPFKDKVNTSYKEACKIRDEVMSITDKTDRANKAIDARNVLDKITKRIDGVIAQASKEGRDTTEFDNKRADVVQMVQDIVNKCLFNIDDMVGSDTELPF
jgi:MoxR-like ATPase